MKRLLTTCYLAFTFTAPIIADDLPAVALSYPSKAWLLMDYDTGTILTHNNGKQKLEPASITKVMTSYLVAEALQKGTIQSDALVTISTYARAQEGSRMFVEQGSKISVENLILGMVIQSGNDSSIALAEYISGTEPAFVQLMNKKAQELGMNDSYFENATGLPSKNHLTTAYDLALLSRHLIQDFPEHYKIYSQKSFQWNNITQENRNRLLWTDPSVDGIKTGHTRSAGFNLAASAKRNDFRVISIVLGANNMKEREKISEELLNYAFQNFEHKSLYKAKEVVASLDVHEGIEKKVAIGFNESLSLTFPRSKYSELKAQITTNTPLIAPITQGTPLGNLEIYDKNNQLILKKSLIALDNIQEAGFIAKMWERLKYKAHNKYLKLKQAL